MPISHIKADVEHLGNVPDQKEQILHTVINRNHVLVQYWEGVLHGLFRLFDPVLSQHKTRHGQLLKDHFSVLRCQELINESVRRSGSEILKAVWINCFHIFLELGRRAECHFAIHLRLLLRSTELVWLDFTRQMLLVFDCYERIFALSTAYHGCLLVLQVIVAVGGDDGFILLDLLAPAVTTVYSRCTSWECAVNLRRSLQLLRGLRLDWFSWCNQATRCWGGRIRDVIADLLVFASQA